MLAYALIMIDQIKGEWAEKYNGKLPKEECLEVIKDGRRISEQVIHIMKYGVSPCTDNNNKKNVFLLQYSSISNIISSNKPP